MNLETLKQNSILSYIFLEMLNSSLKENFMNEFQTFAPEIAEEILSAYVDPSPSCSCRTKIKTYVELNNDKCAEFLYDFIIKNDFLNEFQIIESLALESRKNTEPISISGKIIKTNMNEWETFSKKVRLTDYRGFSILKEGDDLLVFFL